MKRVRGLLSLFHRIRIRSRVAGLWSIVLFVGLIFVAVWLVAGWRTTFASLGASLIATALVLALEASRKLHLLIEVDTTSNKEVELFPSRDNNRWYLRVKVGTVWRGPGRLGWIGWIGWIVRLTQPFITLHPAALCEAKLIFLHEDVTARFKDDSKEKKIAVMQGRWARTAEPHFHYLEFRGDEPVNLDYWVDKTSFVRYVDIPPGSCHELDVVMRNREEEKCHGWHNSYIPVRRLISGLKCRVGLDPKDSAVIDFNLEKGESLVLIEVRTGGEALDRPPPFIGAY